jgi:hypothetical protein
MVRVSRPIAEVVAVPNEEIGDTSRAQRVKDLLARAQALVDAKPGESGHSLEWAVPAYFLGDATALAALSLRSAEPE